MTQPCANCGKRPGTIQWVGEGGALALTHGWYAMWCEVCCLEAQIKYAEDLTAKIPTLKEELAQALQKT